MERQRTTNSFSKSVTSGTFEKEAPCHFVSIVHFEITQLPNGPLQTEGQTIKNREPHQKVANLKSKLSLVMGLPNQALNNLA